MGHTGIWGHAQNLLTSLLRWIMIAKKKLKPYAGVRCFFNWAGDKVQRMTLAFTRRRGGGLC